MSRHILLLLVFGFYFCTRSSAQRIDNSSVFKTVSSPSYFRIQYDNDYFTRTDCYYTQGIEFEYVNSILKKFPISRLLLKPRRGEMRYGISIDHVAYTPTSTSSNQILYGDRPFAACLSLKTFALATDSSRRRRISSALIAGVIGPSAGGQEMQTTIHRWLNNPLPKGWQYQIQNDLILNYQVNYEKELLNLSNIFSLNSANELRIGTLNDKVSGGFSFLLGKFFDPYRSIGKSKTRGKWSYYLYGNPQLSLIAYDASLQGGVFDHQSAYTIPASAISRVSFQGNYGIVVSISSIYLEYCQSYLTREFDTGKYHRWGGVRIGISF